VPLWAPRASRWGGEGEGGALKELRYPRGTHVLGQFEVPDASPGRHLKTLEPKSYPDQRATDGEQLCTGRIPLDPVGLKCLPGIRSPQVGFMSSTKWCFLAMLVCTEAGQPSSGAAAYTCQPGSKSAALPYCDSSLDLEARIKDFVGRLNNADKPLLLTAREMAPAQVAGGDTAPSYYWGTNCLQSVENGAHSEMGDDVPRCPSGRCATHFPSPPNMNAAFNRTLVAAIANTMARELRALFNIGAAAGLDCWGPVLNLNRDVRWGRNGESGPECPFLMSTYSSSFTLGFQRGVTNAQHLPRHAFDAVPPAMEGESPFLNGVATIKHWDGNSLEDSDGFSRHNFNDNVSNFVLSDSYFPAFRYSTQLYITRYNLSSCDYFSALRAGIRMGAAGVVCIHYILHTIHHTLIQLLLLPLDVRVQCRAGNAIMHFAPTESTARSVELQVRCVSVYGVWVSRVWCVSV
jgi:hypothetical protein